jgi:plasmid maintenance system antidote protein VapI
MPDTNLKPPRRQDLHAAIISAGFKSISDFARSIKVSQSLMNAIINNWRFPGPETQQKMCRALGISRKTLGRLLDNEAE